jgi:uncharacterized OB-fold protein
MTPENPGHPEMTRTKSIASEPIPPAQRAVPPAHPLPIIDDVNRDYWCGGADGALHIRRCRSCGFYLHPPSPVCRRCYSRDIGAEAVSGRGWVYSYTVNEQPWLLAFPPPYVIALIELVEQEGLRVLSNIVDCGDITVTMGLPVTVAFAHHSEVHLPVFRPRVGDPL